MTAAPPPTFTPFHVSLGIRLRQARQAARYSTRTVADEIRERYQLDISHTSLARIERAEQQISVGMFCVLCDIYGVAPGKIALGETADPKPYEALLREGLVEHAVAGIVLLEQLLENGVVSE